MLLEKNSKKRKIISLSVDRIGCQEALDTVMSLASTKQSAYVCFANVHMIIESHWEKRLADQVNGASLVLSDGMPLVNAIDILYKEKQERIAGMDFMPELMRLAEMQEQSVFFFGSTEDLLTRIGRRVKEQFPKLRIAGMFSPPFNKSLDDRSYIEIINNSHANLVFVALGCPKQEAWMARNSNDINAVLLGVGGAFPVFAGAVKRAPMWMQKSSLEWLYRFIQEPKRMWKRYFLTNTLFLFLLFKDLLLSKVRRKRYDS